MLTARDLACGYVDRREFGEKTAELYHEYNVYHVRGYDFGNHARIGWEVYHTLREARKGLSSLCRAIKYSGNNRVVWGGI